MMYTTRSGRKTRRSVANGNVVADAGATDIDYNDESNGDQELLPSTLVIPLQGEAAAERYISNCRKYDISVDPSIVIALQTKWNIIKPTNYFREGAMLPLVGILDYNPDVTKLNLSNVGMQDLRYRVAGNGNSNARALRPILEHTTCIEELNLANTGLDDDGMRELSDAICKNNSIKRLILSMNHFGESGAHYLKNALEENKSIEYLDVSRNALGFGSIHSILCACRPKNMYVLTNGNYVFEEILNSISHGVAFLGAVVGANLLISDAAEVYQTDYHFWACVLYSFSLMFLFLSSCLFHSFFMLPTTSRILQVLDHVGIYMLIAGSYTPFLLVSLHHVTSARVLLVAEWLAAFFGSTFAMCSDLNAPATTRVELTIFLCMGLGVLLVWDEMLQALSSEALKLLLIGAFFYLTGIIFFILGEYKPIYHVIWHMFVVLAASLHWFDVYFFVVHTSISDNSPTKMRVTELVDSVSDSMNVAAAMTASVVAVARNFTDIHN